MLVKKLTWAGILIQSGDTVILIDPLGRTPGEQEKPFAAKLGEPHEAYIDFSHLPIPTVIAITHIHPDHFDPDSILKAFGDTIPVLVPIESIDVVKSSGLHNVIGFSFGDTKTFGECKVSATYSMDGYGTPQVSWVIEGEDHRIIHSGDTLWHGNWWRIAREFGGFDIACFPINGAVLSINGLPQQSEHHACMTPEEAVEAAKIVGADKLVPIHFGTFHNAPYYIETPDAVTRLLNSAKNRGVHAQVLKPNQEIELVVTK